MSIYCFNKVINSELKQPEFSLICLLEKTHTWSGTRLLLMFGLHLGEFRIPEWFLDLYRRTSEEKS